MKDVTNVQVYFVEHSDPKKDPIKLGTSTLSFAPTFNSGEKLTFRTAKEGEEHAANVLGEDATHTIKNVHWIFTVVEFEEHGIEKKSDAFPVLVVNLERIKHLKALNINQIKNVFH